MRIRCIQSFKECHDDLVTCPVAGVARPGETLATERSLRDLTLGSHVKDRAPPDEVGHPLRGLANQDVHEFGVVEVCPACKRILAVDIDRVLVAQHCVVATLRHRCAPPFTGDSLGDHDHIAVAGRLDGSPDTSAAASDNQHVRVHNLVYKHLISRCVVYYHKVIAGDK